MILGAGKTPIVLPSRLVGEVSEKAELIGKDPFARFAPTRFIVTVVRCSF